MPLLLLCWLLTMLVTLKAQDLLPAHYGMRSAPVVTSRLKVRLVGTLPRTMHQSALQALGLTVLYPVLPYQRSITASKNTLGIQNLADVLRAEDLVLRSYVVSYSEPIPPEQMADRIASQCAGVVECCSPVYAAMLTMEPNDPKVPDQRMLQTIRAFQAWDVEAGSDSMVIGISDSGMLPDHEDLKDAVAVNTNEIPDNGKDDDGNGYIDDFRGYNFCTSDDGTPPGDTYNPTEGHGTGVVGICAAVGNNSIGIAGVAGRCRIWPIKTMPNNTGGIVYGYESLMYCAENNIPVVNCSWGSTGRSCVDQSIITYVIARGTAVVAAAGNHKSATPFYPASYAGVLGVGVTDPDDNVIGMSGHGPTVDVMAPGQLTTTTTNDGSYGSFCCTSGSSPIASAIVGLVRTRYPALSALQACALVRESATLHPWKDVQQPVNPMLLPYGRVDALSALTFPPDSIPSIEWDSVTVVPTTGAQRWGVADTLQVTMYGTNLLAEFTLDSISDLTFTPSNSVSIAFAGEPRVVVNRRLKRGESIQLRGIRCTVTRATDTTVYIVGTLYGTTLSGEQHVRPVSIAVTPMPAYLTLSNNVLTVSVADRGRIGNADIERAQGAGLIYRSYCGQLYEGALMIAANQKVVDAARGNGAVNDHFYPLKRYLSPDSLTGIYTDGDAPDSIRLGVQIQSTVRFAPADTAVLVLDITLTNISGGTLRDLAAGWFCDWDLGSNASHNSAQGSTAAVPNAVVASASGSGNPVAWCMATSTFSDARLIHTAINNSSTYAGFDSKRKYSLLHGAESGEQYTDVDVATVCGISFAEDLPPNHHRTFRVVFAIDTSWEGAKACAERYSMYQPSDTLLPQQPNTLGAPYPNPSADVVVVPCTSNAPTTATIVLCDVCGRRMQTLEAQLTAGPNFIPVNVSALASGTYELRVLFGSDYQAVPIVIVR